VSSTLRADELARRLSVLRLNVAFDDVPERDLEALASMFDERQVEAGELICSSGESATEVFVVADGEAAIVLGDGKQAATIDDGHIVGELGLFTHRQRTADVVASGACTILALDYERFRATLIEEIAASDGAYYERWAAALERVLVAGGVVSEDELDARAAALEHEWSHDHHH